MNKVFITLIFIALSTVSAFCQTTETGMVIYIDSTNLQTYAKAIKTSTANNKSVYTYLNSRQDKFKVKYNDNFFMTEGVKRCLRIALDAWENKLNINIPINFNINVSEDLDPSLEIKTTVAYASDGRSVMPTSLFAQNKGDEITNVNDTLTINAFANWKTSWDNDGTQWGEDNLQTALLRHIAHLLGFGTSVVERAGGLGFAVRRFASPFDNLVSDGRQTLGSMALRGTPTQINDFFKGNLIINTSAANYKLFSSTTGYVPFRSGNYFSLPDDNILNYPYGDRSALLPINDETLDVMAAIGWDVNPHDIHIYGNNTDRIGYGSLYTELTFHAENAAEKPVGGIWTYQVYDNTTQTYIDRESGQGTSFTISPADEGQAYMDEFACLQGRVAFTTARKTYTLPLTLNARPLFIGYDITNIQETAGSDYYSFDLRLSSRGAAGGDVIVSSDYGTLATLSLNADGEQTLHVGNALKIGSTYLTISLNNGYGTTSQYITLPPFSNHTLEAYDQSTNIKDISFQNELFDVYSLQGVLIGKNKRLSDLDKGTYIIKSTTQSWKSKKIILK